MSCQTKYDHSKDIITRCPDISTIIDPVLASAVWYFIRMFILLWCSPCQGLYSLQTSTQSGAGQCSNALIQISETIKVKAAQEDFCSDKKSTWSWPNSFFLNLHILYHNNESTETILICFSAQTLSIILVWSLEPIKIMIKSFFILLLRITFTGTHWLTWLLPQLLLLTRQADCTVVHWDWLCSGRGEWILYSVQVQPVLAVDDMFYEGNIYYK